MDRGSMEFFFADKIHCFVPLFAFSPSGVSFSPVGFVFATFFYHAHVLYPKTVHNGLVLFPRTFTPPPPSPPPQKTAHCTHPPQLSVPPPPHSPPRLATSFLSCPPGLLRWTSASSAPPTLRQALQSNENKKLHGLFSPGGGSLFQQVGSLFSQVGSDLFCCTWSLYTTTYVPQLSMHMYMLPEKLRVGDP